MRLGHRPHHHGVAAGTASSAAMTGSAKSAPKPTQMTHRERSARIMPPPFSTVWRPEYHRR
jgi:hypothetical protein